MGELLNVMSRDVQHMSCVEVIKRANHMFSRRVGMVALLCRATLPLTSQLGSRNKSAVVSALTTSLVLNNIRSTTRGVTSPCTTQIASFADIGITCGGVTLLPNPGACWKQDKTASVTVRSSRQGAVDMMARSGRGGRGRRGGRGGRSNRADRVRITGPSRAGQARYKHTAHRSRVPGQSATVETLSLIFVCVRQRRTCLGNWNTVQ